MNDGTREGDFMDAQTSQDIGSLDEDATLARIHLLVKTTRSYPSGPKRRYPPELGALIQHRADQMTAATGRKVTVWSVGEEAGISDATVSRLMKGLKTMNIDKTKNGTNGHSKTRAKPSPPQSVKSPTKLKTKAAKVAKTLIVLENTIYRSPAADLSKQVVRGIDQVADQLITLSNLSDEDFSEVSNEQLSTMLNRAGTDLKTLITTLTALQPSA